ncbi:DUF5672 family protein [Mucilaginibacter lacusdianchii]|uniref:DUF5672 family protein n=1 Tax=Mucilaginibacter lacusdianchii TaxID=2684211 RepID=UPI00131D7C33|nr:DUF5672 family protein [Mucilaginibacter sp. JXJ CY 39]
MKKSLVTVVIPIHLSEPSELEKISLAQTLAVLHKYTITFMAPYGLDISWYEDFCFGKAEIAVERFDWKGYEAYSVLQSNYVFYKRFLNYKYILICHLDAFVFRDELEKWCNLGYDYIGSVIYNPVFQLKNTLVRRITGFTSPEYFGNGGFSLKRVATFYRIAFKYRAYIRLYHKIRKIQKNPFYDDLFFTQHFPKLSSTFKIGPKHLAQHFGAAYEHWPEQDLPFNNQQNDNLPFGTHGWIQHHRDFWLPCIRRYGYPV